MSQQDFQFIPGPITTTFELLHLVSSPDSFRHLNPTERGKIVNQLIMQLDQDHKLSHFSQEDRAKVAMMEVKRKNSLVTTRLLEIGLATLAVMSVIGWLAIRQEFAANKITLNRNQLQQCANDPSRPIMVEGKNNREVYITCSR